MEKEFIPYEQALSLKELGFDEPCFSYYYNRELSFGARTSYGEVVEAPTFSQAFRWFREKYRLIIQYIPYELENLDNYLELHHKFKISEYDGYRGGRRNTVETILTEDYEEAELECLKELIEIVKDGKNR